MERKSIFILLSLFISMSSVINIHSKKISSLYAETSLINAKASAKSKGQGFSRAVAGRKGTFTEAAGTEGARAGTLFKKINSARGKERVFERKNNERKGLGRRWKRDQEICTESVSLAKGNSYVNNSANEDNGSSMARGDKGSFAASKYNKAERSKSKGIGFENKGLKRCRDKRLKERRKRKRRRCKRERRKRRRKRQRQRRKCKRQRRRRRKRERQRRRRLKRLKRNKNKRCKCQRSIKKGSDSSDETSRLLCETCRTNNKRSFRRYRNRWNRRKSPCYREYWRRRRCKRKRRRRCRRKRRRRRCRRRRRRKRRRRRRKRKRNCKWRRRRYYERRRRPDCEWRMRRERMYRNRRLDRPCGCEERKNKMRFIVGSVNEER